MSEIDGLPLPRRHWSMATIAIIISMAVLDGVIANIALPTIAIELHTTAANSIWVVNAYQIAIVAALLPLASLGEILGYRRVYQAGVLVFTTASLGCALSHTLPVLIAARVAQGLGAAGIMSMNMAMVRFTFPKQMLGRGIGANAVVVALAAATGPSVAAAILAVAPWPWLFAVNVPLGVIALAIGQFTLPHRPGVPRPYDVIAAGLNALTFASLIMGAEGFTHGGWSTSAALEVLVGLTAGATLVMRSLSNPHPLAPIDLLRIPIFAMSMATSMAAFLAQSYAFIVLPFLIEYGFGRSAVETGLLMTPWSLAVAVAAPLSGRLSDRYPSAVLGSGGLLLMGVGLALLAVMPAHPAALDIAWRSVLCGAGFGLFQSPNNRAMLGSAPQHRVGSAGGMLSSARLLGQTAGATLTALVFRLAGGVVSSRMLLVAAAFAVVAAALSWLKPDRTGAT